MTTSVRKISMLFAKVAAFIIFTSLLLISGSEAQLSSDYYSNSCPNALRAIRTVVRNSIAADRRMAASLIRLHFHDCFVQGCDASILLDETASIQTEKTALPNKDSVRGYNVIDRAKSEAERICPGVVSCADIVTVAARDASEYVGGPSWTVKLGRRDSLTARPDLALIELPGFKSSLQQLIENFRSKDLSARDMVALSGAHTLGQAQCFTFRDRIYSNDSIDAGFASTRRRRCPVTDGNSNLAPLDLVTPNSFDNNYFKNLMQRKGLLDSDQVLYSGGSTNSIVEQYSRSPSTFSADFAAAMIKMGDIGAGNAGEIRRICSAVN